MAQKYTATIETISYDLMNGIALTLSGGWKYIYFIKPDELEFGGKNCEIKALCVGGKIAFDYNGNDAVRHLDNVMLLSDGIKEVDIEGNLIKW